jgi:hypothetical protein
MRSRHVKLRLKVPRFGIGLTQVTAQLHCVDVVLSPETLTIGWGADVCHYVLIRMTVVNPTSRRSRPIANPPNPRRVSGFRNQRQADLLSSPHAAWLSGCISK